MKLAKRKHQLFERMGSTFRSFRYRSHPEGADELSCRFVSSLGLRKSCVFLDDTGTPVNSKQQSGLSTSAGKHTTIFVKTSNIVQFAQQGLGTVKNPFTLVTGGTDHGIGTGSVLPNIVDSILAHPLLECWYAQNCQFAHEKLKPLPIGMDYHTLSMRARPHIWGPFATPLSQEHTLDCTRLAGPPLAEKKLACYCNWHHVIQRGDRLKCINGCQLESMHFDVPSIRRAQSWQNNTQYFFTISPLGEGIDCHRTWESLLLGSVPIVSASGITKLFERLPVCIVEDWNEVTIDYLEFHRHRILHSEFDFAPLYLSYWSSLLRGETVQPEYVQTFQQFISSAHLVS
ncbi:MAG: hypothetical protein P1U83_19865 [Roseovarius sp.]|nr:hypothetical protein [Roseovarius sp.]